MMYLVSGIVCVCVCVRALAADHQEYFCVQVIVERYIREKTLPLLDKTKFLVPFELTLGQFMCLLR